MKEEPGRNWIILIFLLLTGAALWLGTGSWGWVALGLSMMLAMIRQWFLPTRIRLDADGVTVRLLGMVRRRKWTQIKRASADRRGVLLSPFAYATRLELFRGIYLRFSGNRAEVLNFIRRHVSDGSAEKK